MAADLFCDLSHPDTVVVFTVMRLSQPEGMCGNARQFLGCRLPWLSLPDSWCGFSGTSGSTRCCFESTTACAAWFYQRLSCISLPIFLRKSSIDWACLVHHHVPGAFRDAGCSGKVLLSAMWCWCIYIYTYTYLSIYREREWLKAGQILSLFHPSTASGALEMLRKRFK